MKKTLSIKLIRKHYGSIMEATRQLNCSRNAIYTAICNDEKGLNARKTEKGIRAKLRKKCKLEG